MTDHTGKIASAPEQDGHPSPAADHPRELDGTEIPKGIQLKGNVAVMAILGSSAPTNLEPLEERALRMRAGVSVPDWTPLPSQMPQDPDIRIAIKRIEVLALECLKRDHPLRRN